MCVTCGTSGDEVVGIEFTEGDHVAVRQWMKPRERFGFKFEIDQEVPSIPFQFLFGFPGCGRHEVGIVRRSSRVVEVSDMITGEWSAEFETMRKALAFVHERASAPAESLR